MNWCFTCILYSGLPVFPKRKSIFCSKIAVKPSTIYNPPSKEPAGTKCLSTNSTARRTHCGSPGKPPSSSAPLSTRCAEQLQTMVYWEQSFELVGRFILLWFLVALYRATLESPFSGCFCEGSLLKYSLETSIGVEYAWIMISGQKENHDKTENQKFIDVICFLMFSRKLKLPSVGDGAQAVSVFHLQAD